MLSAVGMTFTTMNVLRAVREVKSTNDLASGYVGLGKLGLGGWLGVPESKRLLMWNDEKLAVISDQFSSFDGVLKAKVLLSFLSVSPHTISQVRSVCHENVNTMATYQLRARARPSIAHVEKYVWPARLAFILNLVSCPDHTPAPRRKEKGLVTIARFLGCAESAVICVVM